MSYSSLAKNAPKTLTNDVESALNQYDITVIWNAPNYPYGDLVEYCWGQGKAYADAKHFKGRKMVELAEHIHEGLYTANLARSGVSSVKDGNVVLDLQLAWARLRSRSSSTASAVWTSTTRACRPSPTPTLILVVRFPASLAARLSGNEHCNRSSETVCAGWSETC